ncbi:complex I NDUFA9 subunit family protein [Variovorax rhizosphaerae]|uniref:Complex I NDUFA9 subunit family protein n=1 Tax=Variovorax rhizosphaerae TaxID=1836200 RepID=A0ABU8WWN4_9BURK
MKNILVLGGTGFVGRSLCTLISSSDAATTITVPTRRLSGAMRLGMPPSVNLASADVHDRVQLAKLVEGSDAVVNLIAILHGTEAQFARVHIELVRGLVEACQSTGVRRLVHVSALGVDSAKPSHYLRSKAAGEAVLNGSGLDVTILRPSVIFGERDRFLNLFARLSALAPFFPLACADARFQPVWVEDVARAVVVCLARDETAGQTFECAGPEVFTLAELVKLAGRWSGHERPVLALPDVLGTLQAAVMERLPGEPLMSRDNLQSMQTPNVASGRLATLMDLGIHAAALETVGPSYLWH